MTRKMLRTKFEPVAPAARLIKLASDDAGTLARVLGNDQAE